jgi:hypothetical protein
MSCAWPQGDPKLPGFTFCGAPIARPGLPYCIEHMRRAYLRDPTRRPVLRKSPRPKPSASVLAAKWAVNVGPCGPSVPAAGASHRLQSLGVNCGAAVR